MLAQLCYCAQILRGLPKFAAGFGHRALLAHVMAPRRYRIRRAQPHPRAKKGENALTSDSRQSKRQSRQ